MYGKKWHLRTNNKYKEKTIVVVQGVEHNGQMQNVTAPVEFFRERCNTGMICPRTAVPSN